PVMVASLYGMNVDNIPWAHSPYAFYVPIGLSIAIAVVISWYLLKKKWF
ncbi:MAG: magnesium transporter CorA family protein, partial [Chitinophagaceae bacterium]|nr:magnesium transporter CorA family protein [Chitinophagaceae bacterium]